MIILLFILQRISTLIYKYIYDIIQMLIINIFCIKCLKCNEIYDDDWYSCPNCDEVLVNEDGSQTNEAAQSENQNYISNSYQPKPVFSKLPIIFYLIGSITIIIGILSGLFSIETLGLVGMVIICASLFISGLIFIGFGTIIDLLDIIKINIVFK